MILSLQPWHIDHLPFQPWHRDHFLFKTLITFFCFLFYAGHSSTKVHNQVLCFILHIIFCSWKHETGQSILIHIMQVLSLNLGILPIIMISYLGRGDLNLNQDKLRESKGNAILEAHHGILALVFFVQMTSKADFTRVPKFPD